MTNVAFAAKQWRSGPLAPALEEQLRNQGIWELATTLEFPLVKVLARMEHNGILVDRGYLEKLNSEFGQKMATLEGYDSAARGGEFQRQIPAAAPAHSV